MLWANVLSVDLFPFLRQCNNGEQAIFWDGVLLPSYVSTNVALSVNNVKSGSHTYTTAPFLKKIVALTLTSWLSAAAVYRNLTNVPAGR